MLFLTLLVIIYVFVMGYLGYRGFRGTHTATDYLVAGREIHPVIMALSYGAAFISTSAVVGFGGVAAVYGLGILWLTVLNIFVGIFVAFVFLGSRTRYVGHRLGAHTFPELLGKRYQSSFIQGLTAILILLFMPLYSGVVLMGASKFIEVRFGVDYETALFFFAALVAMYVAVGGLKGVMYADALQGGIMLTGMVLLLAMTYGNLGGFASAHARLTELSPAIVEIMGERGHQGWTAMPAFGSEIWWTLMSSIVIGVGIGVLAQPQLAVRYMTVKSKRELNRAVLVGGVFILSLTGGIFMTGALSNLFFHDDPEIGLISLMAANRDIEQIIPLFITNYMPGWLGDVFFVSLIAAAMSTVCSQFHAMGAAAGRDFYEDLISRGGKEGKMLAVRAGIFITFVMSVALAYILPVHLAGMGAAIVARGTAIFFGLCAATFMPMYVGGLYFRFITRTGAIAGALTGFVISAFWLLFVHRQESSVLLLCDYLFGVPTIAGDARTGFILWAEVDPLVVALPASIAVTIAVSWFTRPLPGTHLDHCFEARKS